MDCHHYDAFRCRSCTLLEVSRTRQLSDKEQHARSLVDAPTWLPTVAGPDAGFRNKAKMAVGGTVEAPTLGILDRDLAGVDLRDCGLHSPAMTIALDRIAAWVSDAGLVPYHVATRSGELKHVLLTESPDGEMLLRLVMRSTALEARVRSRLPALLEAVPGLRVVTVNVQPEHKAVLEGEREIVLTEHATLPMRLATGVTLRLGPRSFFQTNTLVAEALYDQARAWVDALPDVRTVWDLYCGVGGFALHLAAPGRDVLGVEVSADAVDAATRTAADLGVEARFVAADATAYARASNQVPDLVVVNPPRRGIGADLAGWLEESGVRHVVYSSCNAESLARDLAVMPSLRPVEARVLDMFPHTAHYEVMVLLAR
ncbi:23S rRNA (uracil(747)-C(5))-methyltransferase RlmC [Nocardioides flavus (ex Wang et al. 2016)]|uniref:23S rRNA (Uracil(747)-C(5))-methyltransferase RlmC n=1 Tax=Nocardioides flavus (ex Wang et al. 2016) TaxID=2058780 RepID=A0ABQ3HMR8_9ACTN|nr:23S rRNA (uracil(747)-C(5))-methyltransferase RlmC [Nocardioides flavus (ex Wang et al. 2016)]GHE18546.1 23S rRNA (uracil(747)-C(5))-methyltransferase RlmC [Nocardioides flavus (ex Wang et al. 2016)]